jgi:CheY-like chemotaxis protein
VIPSGVHVTARRAAEDRLLEADRRKDGFISPRSRTSSALRRRRAAPLLLVALTGWGQDVDRQRARDAGFDHHLTKPVDPAVLVRLLGAPPWACPQRECGAFPLAPARERSILRAVCVSAAARRFANASADPMRGARTIDEDHTDLPPPTRRVARSRHP